MHSLPVPNRKITGPGALGASSKVATSAAAPTPFCCSSEHEEAGEDRGADSGSLVRGTARGPAQPPTPSDTQEARPQPSTLEYNAVFPDSDTYAQEVDLSELIPQYLAECECYVEPNISRELYALHPRHLFLPRRSARLAASATRPAITQRVMDPPPTLQRKCKAPTKKVFHWLTVLDVDLHSIAPSSASSGIGWYPSLGVRAPE
ncbi:hypothetical protein B0H13DRAFT_2301046 [Mycena leptocephala]|nr:hypothetical protein B0H13DRAFT_2301046 [Mycena leptocephala]